MKKKWVWITVLPFLVVGAEGNAGPLDQLKNFRLDSKAIAKPKQTAVEFLASATLSQRTSATLSQRTSATLSP